MIKKQSDDPNVVLAAQQALNIIKLVLAKVPVAETYDYGGHYLKLGEYGVCERCTSSIAEAQQASKALLMNSNKVEDPVVREHLELAAKLFYLEAQIAVIRAEFHNGQGTEEILNTILGFEYDRKIHDDYLHSHESKV